MASAKLHPLLAFIGARFEYIRCMHPDVATVPAAMVDDTVRSIASHISQSRTIKIEDGVEIQTKIAAAPLPDEAIDKLKALVHDRVGFALQRPAMEGGDDKRQEHPWLESFQTEEDWKLYDKPGNHDAKLMRMAMRCCSINCVSSIRNLRQQRQLQSCCTKTDLSCRMSLWQGSGHSSNTWTVWVPRYRDRCYCLLSLRLAWPSGNPRMKWYMLLHTRARHPCHALWIRVSCPS